MPTLEERMDDVRAVMDAVGSSRTRRSAGGTTNQVRVGDQWKDCEINRPQSTGRRAYPSRWGDRL